VSPTPTHPTLELRQLEYLVAVVEEGQITRAAHRLQVAQPALSQAISRLESHLGVRLLERLPRGIEPTPAGEAFFEKARDALSAVEDAQDVVHPWARTEASLCLGFLPLLGPMARPWLRRFISEHPGVELETRHLGPQQRFVELRRGRIDAELTFPPPHDAELEHLVVLRSPRFVLMHDEHPLARETSLAFAQIADERRPGRHPSVPLDWAQEAWLMNYRGSEPEVTKERPTTADDVWALVSAGKAIAVLPEFMIREVQGQGMRAVPLDDVDPAEVALVRRADDTRATVLALFAAAAETVGGRVL
jgi:DNA-binding transcriptional LysR family regulator